MIAPLSLMVREPSVREGAFPRELPERDLKSAGALLFSRGKKIDL